MRQMMAIDEKVAELNKSGKPMRVLEGVKSITFKKNRSSAGFTFLYPDKDRNIIQEIFELTYGKILSVTYWPQAEKLSSQDSESCLIEE